MILDSTTKRIRAFLGGAITTNQPHYVSSWFDKQVSGETPGNTAGTLNSTTEVEIVPVPSQSIQRVLRHIGIFNTDTVNATVTVEWYDGTNARTWFKALLEPNWSLEWQPGGTWHVYDENGVVQIPAGGGGGGSVTSVEADAISAQAASALSQAKSVLSVTDAALSSRVDSVANAISVVSNAVSAVSTAASNALSVANAASNAASVVSQAVSVVSVAAAAADTHAGTASAAATSVDSRVNAVSNAVSIVSTAASNALSVANAASQAASVVSTAASNALSVANAASNAASIVSARVASVVANEMSILSDRVSILRSSISARSVGDVSTRGMQSIVNALSNRISASGGGGSVTSNEASAISAQAASAISQEISIRSNQHSIALQGISVVSNAASNALSVANAASQAASVVSTAASNALSVANAASNAASIVSARLASIISVDLSAMSINILSLQSTVSHMRSAVSNVSATSAGGGSATGLQAAIDALSNKISTIVGGSQSVTSAEYVSIQSTVSHLASIVSNVSAQSAGGSATGLQAVIDLLSNKISASGGTASVTSNELSGVSAQAASAISNLTSIVGSPQVRFRSNVVSVVSGNALVDLAGLSVALSAGNAYRIEGAVFYEKATSGGAAFGISVPALTGAGSFITMEMMMSAGAQAGAIGAAATHAWGRVAFSATAALNTAVVSASVLVTNAIRFVDVKGFLAVSATGTVQMMARGSVAADSMSVRGGYLRAYKIY